MLLNRLIEIHDAVLDRVSIRPEIAELHFSKVYIHQSEGAPGRDRGSVWVQAAVLRVQKPEVLEHISGLPAVVGDGRVILGKTVLQNQLPLLEHYTGPIDLALELVGETSGLLRMKGSGTEMQLLGEAKYVEEFPGQ